MKTPLKTTYHRTISDWFGVLGMALLGVLVILFELFFPLRPYPINLNDTTHNIVWNYEVFDHLWLRAIFALAGGIVFFTAVILLYKYPWSSEE